MQAPRQTVAPFKLCATQGGGMKSSNFHSIKPILAATALACTVACAGSVGYTQTGAIMIAIDKMTPGASPADFEFARTGQGGSGQWAVAADASAATAHCPEPPCPVRVNSKSAGAAPGVILSKAILMAPV